MSRPVALITAMWNHAATMRPEFAQRKIAWPELTSQDFRDILVYVRGLPGTLHQPDLLLLSSGENGQALFDSKGCAVCHSGKLALGPRLRGQTLTDIAVDMWNHAPRMAKAAATLDLEEMRDLTSYLWAQQFFVASGNPAAGKRVFAAKRCADCHEDASSGAPKLPGARPALLTGPAMVSVLWHHGPQMMEQMKGKGIPWPRFDGADMANLIAYLDSRH
jgi:mono/diheme cytochrome c family protein